MHGLALWALAGCGASTAPTPLPAAKPAPKDQLKGIVERYWDERIGLEDAISPQMLADSLNIERRYLAELQGVPRDPLDANERLTYDIFKRQREVSIEGFTFPSELLPINPFGGMVFKIAAQAADLKHPKAAADYENWLKRIDEYVRWTQQAILNMREGTRRGYTVPRVLVERMLPILDRLGADDADNVFYAPLHSMPEDIKDPERARLTKAISAATSQKLLPANRALHAYLKQEYLPRARTGIAWSDLPLGAKWYAYRAKRATSTSLSPDEIHRIGLAQVERLGAHSQTPHPAPLAAAELLSAYKELAVKVRTAMPDLFSEDPTTDFDIRGTDWSREPGTPLSYRPAGPAGTPPAVLYVDIGRGGTPAVVIASFLEQAIPGRHYQIALQQERVDLPRFRRFGAEPAFTEGWGRYAASQGEALGLYAEEAAKSDEAAEELRCAVGSVVDTGLHAQGWTRVQALDYLRAHLGLDDLIAQSLIDWYAANPADAQACMVGELKIRELRARAQQLLGGRFDVREFHSEILKDGAMPLDILEAKMKVWMGASK